MLSVVLNTLPVSFFKNEKSSDEVNKKKWVSAALLIDTFLFSAIAIVGILGLLKVIPVSPGASWAITIPAGLVAAYIIKTQIDRVKKTTTYAE